jgi:two-component system, cell cycle sensor histidine kinase and response regulator CckA
MSSDEGPSGALEAPEAARLYRVAQEILSTTLARLTGQEFFEQATMHLAEILGAEMGFVGQLVSGSPKRLRTLGLVVDGEVKPATEYLVEGTPCEVVLEGNTRVIPRDVQRLFPDDADLVHLRAEAYGSAPLLDGTSRPIGNVGVLFREPVQHPERVAALIELFALRVATEVERQRGDARFRELFEFSPDAVLMVAEDGRITMANGRAEKILGYPRAQLIGMPVEALVPEDERVDHVAERRRFLRTKLPRVMGAGRAGLQALRGDGTRVAVDISLSPFDSPGGRMVVVAIRDVSEQVRAAAEREKLQEQLRQAQKMEAMGRLAGGIAHDFNNMLSAVFGNVELARRALPEGHPVLEYLSEIRAASGRSADLVRQILTFSRRQGLERSIVAPGEVVDEAYRLLRAVLPATVELVADLDASAPLVSIDTTQGIQVLTNLCTNAWDALQGKPGRIEITLREEVLDERVPVGAGGAHLEPGRYVRISVEDDGQGMDPDTVERVFEPFFTTKAVGMGTGLGLSVALGIMQRHGGAIRVKSTLGHGTRFDLYFPAVAEGTTVRRVVERRTLPAIASVEVLFVDDEPLMVRAASRMLEALGHKVSAFTDAAQALELLAREADRFDVVITDLRMPCCSGVEVVKEVRRLRPNLPVLVMSGHIDEATGRELIAAGAPQLLHKPWSPGDLEDALRGVLSSSSGPSLD